MIVEEFLKNLSEEVGFKFGTPWRYNSKSLGVIVPILREGYDVIREYVTIEEVKDKGVTFKDTGRIDRVMVESSLDMPIFIRSGVAFKSGATQPRAVETSTIIIPEVKKEEKKKEEKKEEKEKIPIPIPIMTRQEIHVRCIHASKPISSGSKFAYSGDVPLEVRSALMSQTGQGNVWGAVNRATNRFMASSGLASSSLGRFYGSSGRTTFVRSDITRDNLVGVMEEVDKAVPNLDEILKNVPLFEDQVGAIFLDIKDVIALEMFDHPKSWEAIHKEVEKRLGESVAKEQESFYRPDYNKVKPLALMFLKKLLESEKTEVSKDRGVSTFVLKGDGVIGEATAINEKIIHMVGIKSDKNTKDKDRPNTITGNTVSISDVLASRYGTTSGIRNNMTYSTTRRER